MLLYEREPGGMPVNEIPPFTHPALSQMIIFNWKGRPNKSGMLDQLAVMRNAASEIGQSHRNRAFGHLVVLLRDVPDMEKNAHDLIFGDEDSTTADTTAEEASIEGRNKTREQLRDYFQSVRVWCLPSPHAEIDGKVQSWHGRLSKNVEFYQIYTLNDVNFERTLL